VSPGRISWAALSVLLAAPALPGAEARLVLPAAASIHGANRTFFHTDLRVLNLSYVTAADVQAVYHCWGGGACASLVRSFTLGPRQNLALDEVVASLFEAAETAGAIEFLYDDGAGPLVVSARLYTPQTPLPSHGGWVAARRVEQATVRCVFGQVALSADRTSGFRTNAGGFNPGPATVTAVYTLRRSDGIALGSASRRIGPGEFFQFDGTIGDAAGISGVTDTNLYLSLAADGPFFPYAVVIDNQSGDLFFIEPADDPVPSNAISLLVTLSRYQFSPGGPDGPPIRLQAGVTYRITFRSNDVEHGISAIPLLDIATAAIVPGADYVITLTPSLAQRGRYTFACTRVCGAGHGGMFGAIEVE
jgi:hypothetical protein